MSNGESDLVAAFRAGTLWPQPGNVGTQGARPSASAAPFGPKPVGTKPTPAPSHHPTPSPPRYRGPEELEGLPYDFSTAVSIGVSSALVIGSNVQGDRCISPLVSVGQGGLSLEDMEYPLPIDLMFYRAVLVGSDVYVYGGMVSDETDSTTSDGGRDVDTLYVLHVDTMRWELIDKQGRWPPSMSRFIAFSTDDTTLYVCGASNKGENRTWGFNTDTRTWESLPLQPFIFDPARPELTSLDLSADDRVVVSNGVAHVLRPHASTTRAHSVLVGPSHCTYTPSEGWKAIEGCPSLTRLTYAIARGRFVVVGVYQGEAGAPSWNKSQLLHDYAYDTTTGEWTCINVVQRGIGPLSASHPIPMDCSARVGPHYLLCCYGTHFEHPEDPDYYPSSVVLRDVRFGEQLEKAVAFE
ncbi:hypothetical protein KIPB_002080 [Kipferlia bialata]|uniref:Uncharacterized protein n=1 Tax=Kipferlia bialata TaxID=797122 RepID=A0A9K3GFX5_9EUKA|nr:hypothetical protein KIPB_002080 [Kipferlia bialata]|eukprot:g2080.t1